VIFDIPGKMKFNEPVVNYGSINTDKIKFTDIINSVDVILPGNLKKSWEKTFINFIRELNLPRLFY